MAFADNRYWNTLLVPPVHRPQKRHLSPNIIYYKYVNIFYYYRFITCLFDVDNTVRRLFSDYLHTGTRKNVDLAGGGRGSKIGGR